MNAVIGYGKGAAVAATRGAAGRDVQSTGPRVLARAARILIAPAAAVLITLCVNWHVHGSSAAEAETTADYFESENLPAAYGFLPIDYDGGLQ